MLANSSILMNVKLIKSLDFYYGLVDSFFMYFCKKTELCIMVYYTRTPD